MTDPGGPDPGAPGADANPLAVLAGAGRPADDPAEDTGRAPRSGKAPKAAKEPKPPKGQRSSRSSGRSRDTAGVPIGGGPVPGPADTTAAALGQTGGGNRPPMPPRTAADDARTSALGFMILAVAVALGALLLWKGYERSDGNLIAGTSPDSSVPASSTTLPPATTLPPTTTSSTAPLKPPSQITVRVANASDPTAPLAGAATTKLTTAGYKTLGAVDATVTPTSAVYYTDDLRGEATEIAETLGIATSAVAEMPTPPPTGATGAQILVVLGQDYTPT